MDRENVQARFENGLLHIELPKSEEAKPRQIRIAGENRKKDIDVKTK